MKRVLLTALGVALALMVSLGGWLAWRSPSPVTVTIKNRSQKPIALVRIEHQRGIQVLEDIAQGQSKMVQFDVGGETSFTLSLRFADGSEIRGGSHYAEPGYEFSETVTDAGIHTDIRVPRGY